MAPSNALTVEEIINRFPNPVLPKIDNEPTFEDIQVTTRLLNANAISIPSMAVGVAHGHLGVIMTQVEYAAISESPWVEPSIPNANPIIPPGTNAVDAAQLACCWTHGYTVANAHTNLSCNFTKQGHKREATRADSMGGIQANKEWCAGAATLNNKTMFEDCQTPPIIEPHETAIVDSGCTGHFLLVNAPCLSKVKAQNLLTVRLPNGATTESTHTSALDIP
jgi:hypothetical protein